MDTCKYGDYLVQKTPEDITLIHKILKDQAEATLEALGVTGAPSIEYGYNVSDLPSEFGSRESVEPELYSWWTVDVPVTGPAQ